ncbi:MAG: EF-P 5-aminopentanol modification-associated protein YfmF [Candidatus Limivicinus sp.]|jgi:predicted Zn-dependent peptidase
MGISRTEIMPGVSLAFLHSDKFKTACMSINLVTQLQRKTASMNALIPYVLRRGTSIHPDMNALSRRMNELYGTAIEPVVRRIGEIQCTGFYASFPESDFLPGEEDILSRTIELMCQLLLAPATRGGLLLTDYVDSEREKMLDAIRSRVNDKRSYALIRCCEEMCCCEDYAVGRFGVESECEGIHYRRLTHHYHDILQTSPIEIFYCGRGEEGRVVSVLRDALRSLPRAEINYDIGTDVRMNSLEDGPRFVEERMDVSQGKLVMGFRLGEIMEDPDIAALYVFNSIYGGSSSSKLFKNVRERLQLCYYASSLIEIHKGLLLVSAGIDPDKLEETRDEILAQLEEMKKGNISDDELRWAKSGVASALRSSMDSQGELEGFYLSQTLSGLDYGPLELAALAEDVSREDVIAVAKSVECDLIYFLRAEENKDGEN